MTTKRIPRGFRPVTNWQPIETAPKNDTWILLRGGKIDYRWDHDEEPPVVVGQWSGFYSTEHHLYTRAGTEERDHWNFAYYDGGWMGEYHNPTEWMPIPE